MRALLLTFGMGIIAIALTSAIAFDPTTQPTQNSSVSDGKKIEVYGTYQEENLTLLNPFLLADNSYCISEVKVNGKSVINDPEYKKIGVDLSSFAKGEYVKIEVHHKSNCNPRILNPKALLSQSDFELVSINVDEEFFKFTTADEKNQEPYVIEQLKHNKWVPLKTIIAKGDGAGYNNYVTKVSHHSGLNKFRVKRRHITNYYVYSKIVTFESTKEAITFYPTRVDNVLHLSESTEFAVFNNYGVVVAQGRGNEINCADLASGIYYLQIDNGTEKFFKK